MDDAAIDARLGELLGAPDPAPDPAFAARIERAVAVERVYRAARTSAWRKFGREALATGAIAAALLVLWRFAPAVSTEGLAFGPAAAGMLAVLLWQVLELRPAR